MQHCHNFGIMKRKEQGWLVQLHFEVVVCRSVFVETTLVPPKTK